MKNILLLTFVLLSLCLGTQARSLVIELGSGDNIYYLLDDGSTPQASISNGSLTIDGDTYAFEEVERFYISESNQGTGIGSLTVTAASGLKVFTLDGRQVPLTAAGSPSAVDTTQLPPGTYILQVNGKTVKFQKR